MAELIAALFGSAASGAVGMGAVSGSAKAASSAVCTSGSYASKGLSAVGSASWKVSSVSGQTVSKAATASGTSTWNASKSVGSGVGRASSAVGNGISNVSTGVGAKVSKAALNAGMASYGEAQELKRSLAEIRAECLNEFTDIFNLSPSVGEIIEFMRDMYSHYGLYVGEGWIVHFYQPEGATTYFYRRDPIETVANGCLCRINNLEAGARRRGLSPLPDYQILQKAFLRINLPGVYHLLDNNCETFATECRYGKGFSEQSSAVDDKPLLKSFGNIAGGLLTE